MGIANQMVVLPLMGFAVATLAGLEGELAVGLIILASPRWSNIEHHHEAGQRRYGPLHIVHRRCIGSHCRFSSDNRRHLDGPLHGRCQRRLRGPRPRSSDVHTHSPPSGNWNGGPILQARIRRRHGGRGQQRLHRGFFSSLSCWPR